MKPSTDIARLLEIMAALRTPETGCPWDLEQDFSTIAPYTIEEAYEVADAIERNDLEDLRDELGDLLLQVVFHARMAEEQGEFDFGQVVEAICRKMIRRHPHVFGDAEARSAGSVKGMWERIKAEEKAEIAERKAARGMALANPGLLDEVPVALPALTRAVKLQKKARTVGFDWDDPAAVLDKLEEEIGELRVELSGETPDRARIEDELGDTLFALANLARHLDIDPEVVLTGTNAKFVGRFKRIEETLAERGTSPKEASLEEMEAIWQASKGGG